ncbi:MAG: hypothetical protein HPY55_13355 [Firmicutes bacterium]|nr:hypothetical protein [Bacillota bacterium]
MTNWFPGVLVFAVLWAVQYALTLIQARHYLAVVRELRGMGATGCALVKGRFSPGAVAVVAAGRDGRIVAARQMRGVSVFARFTPVPGLTGIDVTLLADDGVELPAGVSARAFREAARNLLRAMSHQHASDDSTGARGGAERLETRVQAGGPEL